MSSEEIETIYKKLVRHYANAYPRGKPLWVLNKHIEAYTKNEWKAKELAIIDLALRDGVEIPKVTELIEKGRTRKEAILEVAENMKLRVSETKVKKWLEELEMEKAKKTEKTSEQKIEQQIKDYEKSLERLTTLFSKGEITEESYKVAVKRVEKDIKNLRNRKPVSITPEKKEMTVKPKKFYSYSTHTKPTRLWYLVPFFFSLLGGIIAYVGVKDEDKDMATSLLEFGILMIFVDVFLAWLFF